MGNLYFGRKIQQKYEILRRLQDDRIGT